MDLRISNTVALHFPAQRRIIMWKGLGVFDCPFPVKLSDD